MHTKFREEVFLSIDMQVALPWTTTFTICRQLESAYTPMEALTPHDNARK